MVAKGYSGKEAIELYQSLNPDVLYGYQNGERPGCGRDPFLMNIVMLKFVLTTFQDDEYIITAFVLR